MRFSRSRAIVPPCRPKTRPDSARPAHLPNSSFAHQALAVPPSFARCCLSVSLGFRLFSLRPPRRVTRHNPERSLQLSIVAPSTSHRLST